jgi:catechol 2,3-dioxygenase-like lactoylglutathione lyase family enzyme
MVELITHHGPGPSALRDMYGENESGVHHVAYFVPALAEALKAYRDQGFEVAMEARTTGGVEFAMVDARADVGHMLEFYEPREDLSQFYAFVKQKSQGWDGRDPVRRLTL